jgi:predicted metalloprotease with PDZ domain
MHYRLFARNPQSHYIDVECCLTDISTDTVELQLPAWRPGRYELQPFAKYIRQFSVTDAAGQPLAFRKISRNRWLVQTAGVSALMARYDYYGNVINAGSSFVSEDLLYVNPVNLCLYADGRVDEPCTLALDLPPHWRIACGLTQTSPNHFRASDFYELADSPLIASATVQETSFVVQNVGFHVWVEPVERPGLRPFDPARLVRDFSRFIETQLAIFGDFPESDYHFLVLALPTALYHGVEHRNSTVLVLGPAEEGEGLYQDLLGVSSHELFHAWNIVRIRPAELLPYDLTRENYFETCFVAEGVTTYYGDLLLRRSGVFDDAAYLKELQVLMKRHFEQAGNAAQSLLESSWDLWLDGYDKGVPGRKVSVYHKGAIVALILDLHLRRCSDHARSLDDVMRLMWQRFGKPFVGYSLADYRAITEEIAGESLAWYYDLCIAGNGSLFVTLNELLAWVGLHATPDETGGIHLLDLADPAGRQQRARWFREPLSPKPV